MLFKKKKLCVLPACYSVTSITYNNDIKYLFAPDDKGPCYCIDSKTFEKSTVWENGGGTMSMVPIPGSNGDFIAISGFYPEFNAKNSSVIHLHFDGNNWIQKELFKLPYLHRLDILSRGGKNYVICCTLCSKKDYVEDWRTSGSLYTALLPEDLDNKIVLNSIAEGMFKNHGYLHKKRETYSYALTSCDQGVFKVIPPEIEGKDWEVNKILDHQVSDIALADIDGDGEDELAVISPFHGSEIHIYKNIDNKLTKIYTHNGSTTFYHAIWGGVLRGENVFIFGGRSGRKELFLLKWDNNQIIKEQIEYEAGASNVAVINGEDKDYLLAANHELDEGSIYEVYD